MDGGAILEARFFPPKRDPAESPTQLVVPQKPYGGNEVLMQSATEVMPHIKVRRNIALYWPIAVMCLLWFVLGNASSSSAQNRCQARCPDGSMSEGFDCNSNYVPACMRAPAPRNGENSNDNRAADQARAEAAAAAEAQRQREAELEQQRLDAENKRRAEEIAKQAKFDQEKRDALGELKGIPNGDDSASGLKDVTSTDSGLKNTLNAGDSMGLKTLPDRLAERQRLQGEDTRLSQQIAVTIEAVRRMHFDRRAEDYEAWIKLSQDSQKELVAKVEKETTTWMVDAAQDKMLETFKRFDETKAERLVAWLEETSRRHDSPAPVEVISAIRRLSNVESKGRIAYDAKYVLKAIDRILAGMEVKDLQQGLPILLDCVCDLVANNASLEKHCKVFRSVSDVTVAALYNNVTRRVAIHEVEQLNDMTETDLRTLDNYTKELKELMTKRNQVRQQIHMLSAS